jgi:hypothetical protein
MMMRRVQVVLDVSLYRIAKKKKTFRIQTNTDSTQMHTTLLLIDSQRTSTDRGTTSSSFTWTPSQPLRDVKAVELLQATIPNTALTIAAPHNTLLFGHDTATPATPLTIPPAVYTPETLATVLGTLMTAAASPATYTVAASDGFQFAVSHDAGGGEKTSARCTDLSLCRKLGLTSGTTHVTTAARPLHSRAPAATTSARPRCTASAVGRWVVTPTSTPGPGSS